MIILSLLYEILKRKIKVKSGAICAITHYTNQPIMSINDL